MHRFTVKTWILTTFLVATCARVVAEDGPRTVSDYLQSHGGGFNTRVPEVVLRESDVLMWAQILGASEAQSQFMTTMYNRFVEQHNAYLDREAPRYLALSVEFGQAWSEHGHSSPELLRVMRRMNRASASLRRDLTSIEHDLIRSFEPILSDEQRDRLTIIRQEATRRNCRTFHSPVRWTGIELRDIWNEVSHLADFDERSLVEPVLADYEARLTSLVCARADLSFEHQEQLAENRIALVDGSIPPERGAARYNQLRRRLVGADQNIRRHTENTVARVQQLLSEDASNEFLARAKAAAFPELYPDTRRLHELFESAIADEHIRPYERAQVVSASVEYATRYERICKELEEFCVDFGDRNAEGLLGYRQQYLFEALRPLLEKRILLAREFRMLLEEVIGEDALALHRAISPVDDPDGARDASQEEP